MVDIEGSQEPVPGMPNSMPKRLLSTVVSALAEGSLGGLSYLAEYLSGASSRTNLINPNNTSACHVRQYRQGSDYLATINLNDYYYGWRDAAIVVIFARSPYAMVFLLMKLRIMKQVTPID
jgi:ABC-type multidrug transport system permease subunit